MQSKKVNKNQYYQSTFQKNNCTKYTIQYKIEILSKRRGIVHNSSILGNTFRRFNKGTHFKGINVYQLLYSYTENQLDFDFTITKIVINTCQQRKFIHHNCLHISFQQTMFDNLTVHSLIFRQIIIRKLSYALMSPQNILFENISGLPTH